MLTPQIPPSICYLPQHLLQPGSCLSNSLSKQWHSCTLLGPTSKRTIFTSFSSWSQISLIGPPELFMFHQEPLV